MPTASPDTSLSLLGQLRESDSDAAWDRLVALYTTLLQHWFRAAGLQPADGDDLTQRVLEILYRRMRDFRHNGRPGAFRAWLRSIVANLLREFWRQRPMPGSASALDQLVDPHSNLSELWNRQHNRHVLHALLEMVETEFSSRIWAAFCRVGLDGASAAEVADELDMSVNSVLVAKSRVLARMRQAAAGLLD